VEQVAFLPPYGNFAKVNIKTADISWRATTTPMGFARLSREIPTYEGIPPEEVRERLWQGNPITPAEAEKRRLAFLNKKLWEDIQSGAVSVDEVKEEEDGPLRDDDDADEAEDAEKEMGNNSSDDDEPNDAAKKQAKKDSQTLRAMRKQNLEDGNFGGRWLGRWVAGGFTCL
jgi:hypothetical protein